MTNPMRMLPVNLTFETAERAEKTAVYPNDRSDFNECNVHVTLLVAHSTLLDNFFSFYLNLDSGYEKKFWGDLGSFFRLIDIKCRWLVIAQY